MPRSLWLSLAASAVLVVLLPLLFSHVMLGALERLHIEPRTAAILMIAIIAGGFVNIPIKRIPQDYQIEVHPLTAFGLGHRFPQLRRIRTDTVIAVNLGGCVIPSMLVLYELSRLDRAADGGLLAAVLAAAANTAVCYLTARPVPGVGITMPGLLSAFVAAGLALVLAPAEAAPVAWVAGVAGPLIGADLLHLRDFAHKAAGTVSIGGAGTFDGIVLSGIVAAYLA